LATEAPTNLGDLLLSAREQLLWRQKDVSKRLAGEAEANHISRWERNQHVPTEDRMAELIRVLELEPFQAWWLWSAAECAQRAERARVPGARMAWELRAQGEAPAEQNSGRRRRTRKVA
jgi:transcriptional regulator with XRE-family HTH domain